MNDCVFCKIGAGDIPSTMLHKDEDVYVIADINPKAPTHLLIIPLEHVGALTDDAPGRTAVLGRMVEVASEMAKQEGIASSGYRLIINQGPDSGQEVPHLHLHLLAGRRLGAMG
ncbi:MAG: histidine triad (HIT) family protein [Chloroflexi bacterium]|nr:MAG: histidine triad (HIT) family protein [Chloroflexota bacterium]